MTCIFCRGAIEHSNTEHILPESLGGGDWACLPAGIVCGSCNQYFGSKVEPFALRSFPFLPFRLLLGIPTKKNRAPAMETHVGIIRAHPVPGRIGLDPNSSEIEAAVEEGRTSQLRILAEPTEPLAVCRLLLKMAIEVIAVDSKEGALSERYDAARTFARAPRRFAQWWFLIHTDHERLFERFQAGLTYREWLEQIELRVSEISQAEMFVLKLLDMTLMTPVLQHVMPCRVDVLPEPEYRLFRVQQR